MTLIGITVVWNWAMNGICVALGVGLMAGKMKQNKKRRGLQ